MGKAKRKTQQPADFTEAKRQAMGYAEVAVTERGQVIGRTTRRRCPAYHWSWLTDAERASLIRYADLEDMAEVTVKGCLAPVGGGESLVGAERRMMRRDDFDRARRAAGKSPCALIFTEKALKSLVPFDVLCDEQFGAPREAARMTGKAFVGIVARDLVRYFGA